MACLIKLTILFTLAVILIQKCYSVQGNSLKGIANKTIRTYSRLRNKRRATLINFLKNLKKKKIKK